MKLLKTLFLVSLLLILGCLKQASDGSEQTITGNLVVDVRESQVKPILESTCRNAQAYNMCDELDTKLSDRYEYECCIKYGLCC